MSWLHQNKIHVLIVEYFLFLQTAVTSPLGQVDHLWRLYQRKIPVDRSVTKPIEIALFERTVCTTITESRQTRPYRIEMVNRTLTNDSMLHISLALQARMGVSITIPWYRNLSNDFLNCSDGISTFKLIGSIIIAIYARDCGMGFFWAFLVTETMFSDRPTEDVGIDGRSRSKEKRLRGAAWRADSHRIIQASSGNSIRNWEHIVPVPVKAFKMLWMMRPSILKNRSPEQTSVRTALHSMAWFTSLLTMLWWPLFNPKDPRLTSNLFETWAWRISFDNFAAQMILLPGSSSDTDRYAQKNAANRLQPCDQCWSAAWNLQPVPARTEMPEWQTDQALAFKMWPTIVLGDPL